MDKVSFIGDKAINGHKIKATINDASVKLEHMIGTHVHSTKLIGPYEYDAMLCEIPTGTDRLRYILYTNFAVCLQ